MAVDRRVLILNTSHNDLAMIHALRDMDQYVIATGGQPGLVGQKYADEYICMDYSDKDKVLELAREKKIDGICSCCNDFGVETAAYVAERLNLKGHDSLQNIHLLHHKNEFKKLARKLELSTPEAEEFDSLSEALTYVKSIAYPVMIKAVDLSAGNGISKVKSVQEAEIALKTAFEKSRIKKVVVEQFVEGSQHAICTFLKDRKVIAVTDNNEYSFVNPYRVEIDTWPADSPAGVREELIAEIEKAAEYLCLADGIFHMQYRMADGRPYILEPMRRTLGNMYGIPARLVSGFNWDYWEARSHVGLDISNVPHRMQNRGFAAYRSILAKRNGAIKQIRIGDTARKYMTGEYMLRHPGDVISNHMSQLVGICFFQFESRDQMEHVMLECYDDIEAVMEERELYENSGSNERK